MCISKVVGNALTAFIAVTMLAGCSGGVSPVVPASLAPPVAGTQTVNQSAFQNGRINRFLGMRGSIGTGDRATTPSFMNLGAVGKPLVFGGGGTAVDIYLQAGKNKMVGQITGFTFIDDVATDAAADLYVVDQSAPYVQVFAPPYTNGPKLTLDPGSPELGIGVSSQGVVGVTACINQPCVPGVVFYAHDSTAPCATVLLDEPAFAGGLGWAAFDSKGRLYVEGTDSGDTDVVIAKIDGGCNAKKSKTLTLGNTFTPSNAGGIKIDKAGHVAIVELPASGPTQIDTYGPPKGGSLGNPISTTSLVGASYYGPLAFVPSGRRVWVGNISFANQLFASEYSYPAGGASIKSIITNDNVFPAGLAVTPALLR